MKEIRYIVDFWSIIERVLCFHGSSLAAVIETMDSHLGFIAVVAYASIAGVREGI